jgi:hypothetical protein
MNAKAPTGTSGQPIGPIQPILLIAWKIQRPQWVDKPVETSDAAPRPVISCLAAD